MTQAVVVVFSCIAVAPLPIFAYRFATRLYERCSRVRTLSTLSKAKERPRWR